MINRLLTILFVVVINTYSYSQSLTDIGKIAVSVIMPDQDENLSYSQISKLETKITKIASSAGIAASGYDNNIVIYPVFEVYDTKTAEGGLQNITIATCELSLFIKQLDNSLIFASVNKKIVGSGKNLETAITNAISEIPINNAQFKSFLESGKGAIIQYYNSKCQDIIAKSEVLAKMQNYEEAIGLLMSVPVEASLCYNKIQEKSAAVYTAYQNQRCGTQLQEAKSLLAVKEYHAALEILGQIDPSTKCYDEAERLIKTTSQEVDQEIKKQYNDDINLEKQRIDAIKEMAIAYYKSQPTTINYSNIIR